MQSNQLILNKYRAIKNLGNGGFGNVILVSDNQNNTYALKQMSKANANDQIQYLYQEVQIMKELNSEYIVQFYQWEENQENVYILLEYCSGGDLRKNMSIQEGKVFKLNKAIEVMADVIRGLEVIHSKGILHRDIKVDNILVQTTSTGKQRYKICDFGLSKDTKVGTTVLGTGHYMSPQIFQQSQYGFQIDMWAFGVLFYFVLNRDFPFKVNPFNDDLKDKYLYLTKQATKFSYRASVQKTKEKKLQNCTDDMEDLFKRIFEINQDKRITFASIRKHPVFSKQFPDEMTNQSTMMYKHNKKQKKQDIFKSGKKALLGQTNNNNNNMDIKKSVSRPIDQLFPKEKKLLQLHNDQINFLLENFKQFREVTGILTTIEKMPLCYNLAKYYLVLKRDYINSLLSGEFHKKNSQYRFAEFSKTQSYKKLISEFNDQYEIAKYQFQIIYDQCQGCLEEINKINEKFIESFQQPLDQTVFEGSLKKSYRKSTSFVFTKLKVFLKDNNSGNKYSYFLAIIAISHVFNRLFQEQNNCKEVFKKYFEESKSDFDHIDFAKLREWMSGALGQHLNSITKKIITLYF